MPKKRKKKKKKPAKKKPAKKKRPAKSPVKKKRPTTGKGKAGQFGIFSFRDRLKTLREDVSRFADKSFPIDIFKVAPGRQIDFFVHKGVTVAVRTHPTKKNRYVISAVKEFTKTTYSEFLLASVKGRFYTYKNKKHFRIDEVKDL